MARISIGNDLSEPKLAPGWKLSDDGYGLRTLTCTYSADTEGGFDFFSGEAFPISEYDYMKLFKQSSVFNALGVQLQTCDYVGIDPDVNEGVRTNPNTSSANGLTSENITAHPNFFTAASGYSGVIAGISYEESSLGPLVDIKDPLDYISVVIGVNSDGTDITAKVTKRKSYIGQNGACFEDENGGRFIGFVDKNFPSLYGKTSYLASTTSYSGIMYSTQLTDVQALLMLLNTATSTRAWGVFNLLPDWAPVGTVSGVGHVNLLSQVNVENYGPLYKIMYEIRYAKAGWNSKVYVNISGEGGGS